jgi:hypothetical protein
MQQKIVAMSVRAFETDVNVGGIKGDCPPEYDSIKPAQKASETVSLPPPQER